MQRALGERRERADLLDVVSEELDAKRLSPRAREHVDETSADGNLSALVDAFGPLVSGECEGLDERVETDVAVRPDLDRFRSRILGRKSFRESARRRADETSSGEDVERSRSFADEVCRGLEPRAELDTAARKQRDFRRIGVPGDGLCGIARLLVLGKKTEEGSPEGLVQRCQHKRKCGLRHPRRRWKVARERTKTLALGERGHEPVERRDRLVHTSGGNRVPRLHRSLRLQHLPRALGLVQTSGFIPVKPRRRQQQPPGALPCPYKNDIRDLVTRG